MEQEILNGYHNEQDNNWAYGSIKTVNAAFPQLSRKQVKNVLHKMDVYLLSNFESQSNSVHNVSRRQLDVSTILSRMKKKYLQKYFRGMKYFGDMK